MAKVVVIGGGWAGVSAAVTAAKAGAQVTLLERCDMLLGTGLVGGIMRNNGRFTATEEMIALGGGDMFEVADACSRHKNIEFPGHKHANLYDISAIEPAVRKRLDKYHVDYRTIVRATDVVMDGTKIKAVVLDNGEKLEADAFVEASGTAGPMGNCAKYGNGCAMCIYRCPTFGPRVSIAAKAGVKEFMGKKKDGTIGAMSGSCKLFKESLSQELQDQLNNTGVAIVPIPKELQEIDKLASKACQQYALKEFAENVILLDTGHAKLMTPYFPLDMLRAIPGFANARYEDPYSGGVGNSMRYLALSPRDNFLKVEGIDNLFCAGEKAGLLVGHTEAIATGSLAGHNAVRHIVGKELLKLPETLAVGDAIVHVNEQMKTESGMGLKYTFSGSVYFERMKEKNLYTTDIAQIKQRVADTGLTGVMAQKLV